MSCGGGGGCNILYLNTEHAVAKGLGKLWLSGYDQGLNQSESCEAAAVVAEWNNPQGKI